MILSRLPVAVCLLLIASAIGLASSHPQNLQADTSSNSWLDKPIEVASQKPRDIISFQERAQKNSDCVNVKTRERWQGSPVEDEKCVYSGATGYYGEDNTSKFITPFGTDRVERLYQTDNMVDLIGSTVYQVPNTNKLVTVNRVTDENNITSTQLNITDDWDDTYPTQQALLFGSAYRKKIKGFDYTLNDAGQPVQGVGTSGMVSSANGEWLNVLARNKAHVLLNLVTHTVIPYAAPDEPTYSVRSAVSNDGRFVAKTFDLDSLKIYDTTRCGAAQGAFVSRSCQSKDLLEGPDSFLKSLFPGKEIVIGRLNFVGNGDALDIDLWVKSGSESSYYTYRIKPSGSEPVKYLAMGDSFSSGEGAYDYVEATDKFVTNEEYNVCHISRKSYPYLLQQNLQADWFHSVACSGADSLDINYEKSLGDYLRTESQAKIKVPEGTSDPRAYLEVESQNYISSVMPGYSPQLQFVSKEQPNTATISIGGNDINFAGIVASCVFNGLNIDQTCFDTREERESKANEIDQKISAWSKNFVNIKNSLGGSDPKLYVIGYPKLISPNLQTKCGLNVPFNDAERLTTDKLIEYFNSAIKVAADAAGVRYVDVSDAFTRTGESRLCSGSAELAVNGLDLRRKLDMCESAFKPSDKAMECPNSFHPNQLGHKLMNETILSMTAHLTQAMPQNFNSTADLVDKRAEFVGDVAITLQNHRITFQKDIAPGLIAKGENIHINLPKAYNDLPAKPGTPATVTMHSTPRELGQLAISSNGTISGTVQLPIDIETGYHTLFVRYTDIADNIVERYTYFYVAQSATDWDGDGINNDSDACSGLPQSNIDQDKDGIDDACDSEYAESAQATSLPGQPTAAGNQSSKETSEKSSTTVANTSSFADILSRQEPTSFPNSDSTAEDIFDTIPPKLFDFSKQPASTNSSSNMTAFARKDQKADIDLRLPIGIMLTVGAIFTMFAFFRNKKSI